MSTPVVFQYQQALDQFRREGREPPLLKRMSELISLLDLTTTLSSGLSNEEILDAALLLVMGELQASRGALFVQGASGYELKASRGVPAGAARVLPPDAVVESLVRRDAGGLTGVFEELGLEVLSPVYKGDRVIAVLGLGPRAGGRPYGEEEASFLRSVAACAATPIENGLIHHELEQVNQKLSLKVFQLRNLFEISRELTVSLDEEGIKNLVTTTLMGQLMVSRCAIYLLGPGGLALAHERGLKGSGESALVPEAAARPVLESLRVPLPVAELPPGLLRERLLRTRMSLAVPLHARGRVEGLLAAGERASGAAFTAEDREFALTLGQQAMAALEGVRLHEARLEKQRRDRELQIAREIQQSLFPRGVPEVPGFEVAAVSQSCYQVGGDHYDHIPLPRDRVALAIADVAGKGTPASILMASVHAWLRGLAGTAEPGRLMERLNRFLFESTQENKYVTLFYAELDPERGLLRYVNAGHVPPFLLRADGADERLGCGGPVLGLIEDASYEAGEAVLAAGDLVAMVTDGVTEALSPDDQEFADERTLETLRRSLAGPASQTVAALVDGVGAWTGAAGCSDDLTVMVLKARPA